MITKEEQLILVIHEMALAEGDVFTPVDPVLAAKKMRLTPHTARTMQHLLTRGNFIKSNREGFVFLTERGIDLVALLQKK